MTKDKNFFLFHRSFFDSLKTLDEDNQSRFYRYIVHYVFMGIEPDLDGFEKVAWDGFKSILDTDEERYEYIRQTRSEAGKKGNEKRWSNRKSDKNIANATENNQNKQNKHLVESVTEPSQAIAKIANATNSSQMRENQSQNIANVAIINKDNNITRNINITRNNNDDDEEEQKNVVDNSSSFSLRFEISWFVDAWNILYDSAKDLYKGSPMHKLHEFDSPVPVDGQERLDRLVCDIVQYIREGDKDALFQTLYGRNATEGMDFNDEQVLRKLCGKIIERSMLRLAYTKMKPKSSNFGTFGWFMKFENVKKLLNGDIQ